MLDRINMLREELNKILDNEDPSSAEALKISQELDKAIVEFERIQNKLREKKYHQDRVK